MAEAQYFNTISAFLDDPDDLILGALFRQESYDATTKTKEAWASEIHILKEQLECFRDAENSAVIFEYTIPRVGGRIDCCIIINNILFVIEFKTGLSHAELASFKEQLTQYVTDLKNYHFESYDVPVVPVLLMENLPAQRIYLKSSTDDRSLYHICSINKEGLCELIQRACKLIVPVRELIPQNWVRSPYCPTSDIIEAARKLFAGHTVEDIKRSDSKGENLVITTKRLMSIINDAKKNNKKVLCMITGVPGAGKTLVGLSVATQYKTEEIISGIEQPRSVYLSGNHPLVTVLQEALTIDAVERRKVELKTRLSEIDDPDERKRYKRENKVTKESVRSEVKQFIQMIYLWRKDYLRGISIQTRRGETAIVRDPSYYQGDVDFFLPYDHVAIFDEAQRTWNDEEHTKFVRTKSGIKNFPKWSEARFLISCMDRHDDWAVIVCLIGTGQDINHGEAGIGDWIKSIEHFNNWQVYAPDGFQKEIDCSNVPHLITDPELHLNVNLRSLRAENVSSFVDCLLLPDAKRAAEILRTVNDQYEIRVTRDFGKAKKWLKEHAKQNERYGIVASSKAQRLKPLAIDVSHSQSMNVKSWFLSPRNNVHSSFYMEDIATEFQVQGLEIDWACVAWDGDLVFDGGHWKHRQFRVNGWQNINKDYLRNYHINAYRVILTRARRGMIICVPEGDLEDPTRNPEYYNSTYEYLKEIGIQDYK